MEKEKIIDNLVISDYGLAIAMRDLEDELNLSSKFSDEKKYQILNCKGDGSCLIHATSPINLLGFDKNYGTMVASDYKEKRQNMTSAMRRDISLLQNLDNIKDDDFEGANISRIKGFFQALGEHYYDIDPNFVSQLTCIALDDADSLKKSAMENPDVWQEFLHKVNIMINHFSKESSFLSFDPCCFYLADINQKTIAVKTSGDDRGFKFFYPKGIKEAQHQDDVIRIHFTRNYDKNGNDIGSHFNRVVNKQQWHQMVSCADRKIEEERGNRVQLALDKKNGSFGGTLGGLAGRLLSCVSSRSNKHISF